jgi:hypothetical protein
MVAPRYLVLCFLILLTSCQLVVNERLPTPMPTQAFLPRVIPEHGERISYDEYVATSDLPDWAVGLHGERGHSAICVYYNALYIIEDGDEGLRAEDYISRSLLLVNGEIWPDSQKPAIRSYMGLMGSLETGNAYGPYDFCWKIELEPGLHTVEFKTRTTSGKEFSYTWSFVITE